MARRFLVVIGTRPEAIKMAPVFHALARSPGTEVMTCITSQHRELLRPMLDFFKVPIHVDLDVMAPGQSLADVTSKVLHGMTRLLREQRPDMVLVQGDTTTAFTGALAAFYERVAVGHVEAGLRSGNLAHPFPEEANRRFVDVFADWLFAPTLGARNNLVREGADPSRIVVTGNTGIDALLQARRIVRRLGQALPVALPADARLVLLTAHRRESFGQPLEAIFGAVRELLDKYPKVHVLFPMHPNPHVRGAAARLLAGLDRIHLVEPLEYPEFVAAMSAAEVILTDSGGVQEEAPALGKRVLVLRETTERPEGIEAGVAELVGTEPSRILSAVTTALDDPERRRATISPYGDGQASRRIVEALRVTPNSLPLRRVG